MGVEDIEDVLKQYFEMGDLLGYDMKSHKDKLGVCQVIPVLILRVVVLRVSQGVFLLFGTLMCFGKVVFVVQKIWLLLRSVEANNYIWYVLDPVVAWSFWVAFTRAT
uniref:Uncharacterized protein n=1 Tax=Lactuca sativa TaxID=4236 RepID=A0A9R1VGN2_LACSA|nr:hypothetical protein LSAT_V11C500283290 [Lactuca sativa]